MDNTIEFSSDDLSHEEYRKLKEELKPICEGTGFELIDPKKEVGGGFQNSAFLEMVGSGTAASVLKNFVTKE